MSYPIPHKSDCAVLATTSPVCSCGSYVDLPTMLSFLEVDVDGLIDLISAGKLARPKKTAPGHYPSDIVWSQEDKISAHILKLGLTQGTIDEQGNRGP